MKIADHYKPSAAIDREHPHPELVDPYFDAEAERLIATDGHMMLVAPAQRVGREKSRYISGPKGKRKFPDWKKVVPPFREGDPSTITFGIDAALLARACEALGGTSGERRPIAVTIGLKSSDDVHPFEIRSIKDSDEARVYVMPVALDFSAKGQRCAVKVQRPGKRKVRP